MKRVTLKVFVAFSTVPLPVFVMAPFLVSFFTGLTNLPWLLLHFRDFFRNIFFNQP
jgi:hypothetical protein